jgi:hypothetical protein
MLDAHAAAHADDTAARAVDGPASRPSLLQTDDLVRGLDTIVDVLTRTGDALTQLVQLIEGRLSTMTLAEDVWVPVRGAQPPELQESPMAAEQMSEERVFDGVPVTIMRMAPAPALDATPRIAREYQLGYGKDRDTSVFLVRTASREQPVGDAAEKPPRFSDRKPLLDAPLDLRFHAAREIARLVDRLTGRPETLEASANGVL